MEWKFEEEFRLDKPETIGETDRHFDLDNYKDWLEFQLAEARKQLSLFGVMESDCDHEWINNSFDQFGFLQEQICDKCGAKQSVP